MPKLKRTILAPVMLLVVLELAAFADWKLKWEAEAAWRYDTNVFNLSPSQIAALETPSTADIANGHYRDMAAAWDHIIRPQLSLAFQGPGLFGKRLEIKATAGYDMYTQSSRRSNLEAAL